MNSYKAVKVAELRAKLGSIPAKLILSVVILFALNWDTDLETTAGILSGNPFEAAKDFVIYYGLLSYVYFFVRIFNSYIVGILVAAAGIFAIYSVRDKIEPDQLKILTLIMLFGGPALDIIRLLRYSSLKKEVIEESEALKDRIDDIYENVRGFDEGYDRGYYDGYERGSYEQMPHRKRKSIGRKKRRRNYDEDDRYIEDSYYDDEYEDDYDEEYDEYEDDGYDDGYEEEYDQDDDRLQNASFGFFEGCKSPEAIKRRYRELCKVYHPDSGNGSAVLFQAVNDEYRRLMDE